MYDYNAQPITACPDDPARTATPDFREVSEEEIETLADDYEYGALAVLNGNRPFFDIEGERLGKEQIYEQATEDEESEILAPLLVGDKVTAEKLLRKWAYRKAERRLT